MVAAMSPCALGAILLLVVCYTAGTKQECGIKGGRPMCSRSWIVICGPHRVVVFVEGAIRLQGQTEAIPFDANATAAARAACHQVRLCNPWSDIIAAIPDNLNLAKIEITYECEDSPFNATTIRTSWDTPTSPTTETVPAIIDPALNGCDSGPRGGGGSWQCVLAVSLIALATAF